MKNYLLFRLKTQPVAVLLEHVVEVLPITEVYRTKEAGVGVMSLKGQVFPVLEPLVLRNLMPTTIGAQSRILLIEKNGYAFGLMADQVMGVLSIDEKEIKEEDLSEIGYSEGVYQGTIKILRLEAYLTQQKTELYQRIRQLTAEEMQKGYKTEGVSLVGQEKIIQEINTLALNVIIDADWKKADEETMEKALKLHELARALM